MGPPPFGGGNATSKAADVSRLPASMGPPPFGGGNVDRPEGVQNLCLELQWGHRLSAVEIAICADCRSSVYVIFHFSRTNL